MLQDEWSLFHDIKRALEETNTSEPLMSDDDHNAKSRTCAARIAALISAVKDIGDEEVDKAAEERSQGS